MTDIGWILGALVLGGIIGAAVVWFMTRQAAGPGHSVKALREENEKFREEVNDHFVETADLINELTDSYKKVFDHLSEGAEKLVDEAVIRERMPQVSDQEIRLKRIGTRVASSEAEPEPEIPTPPSPDVPVESEEEGSSDAQSTDASPEATGKPPGGV
ncbi:MAG: DUF1043 family protein [Pseudomonadota bacterium]